MSEVKDFNRGYIKGVLQAAISKQTAANAPYLLLKLRCEHPDFGDVEIFGKLWGAEKIKGFRGEKLKKGDSLKVQGFFGQYEYEGAVVSNYNVYKVQPWGSTKPTAGDFQATFVMVGSCVEFERRPDEDFALLKFRVVTPGKTGKKDFQADFTFDVDRGALEEFGSPMAVGAKYKIKGRLMRPEDEFGDTEERVRAVVARVEDAFVDPEAPPF